MQFKEALQYRVYKPQLNLNYMSLDMEYHTKTGTFIESCVGKISTHVFHHDMESMLDYLFELGNEYGKKLRLFVFAGDIAEFAHIIKHIRTDETARETIELEGLTSGEKVIALKLMREKAGKIQSVQLRDLYALLPTTLAQAAEKFAPHLPKLAHDFETSEYNPETDRAYLERDVDTTAYIAQKLDELMVEKFGVQCAYTAAGTAMRAFRHSIPKGMKYFRQNSRAEDSHRKAYRGGYVHPGYDGEMHENVVSYDRTAAYGTIMKDTAFPVGNGIHTNKFIDDKFGIYECEVTAINPPLPIIPYNDEHNVASYLGNPHDSCITTITSEEIIFARKHGYDIQIIQGDYWHKSEYVFTSFMEKVMDIEQEGGTSKDLAKLQRNSLYGRFGTKKTHRSLFISKHPETKKNVGTIIPVCDIKGAYIEDLWYNEEEVDAPYIQPHWAAAITSRQRLWLFENIIERIGVENFYGCDTDSIKMTLPVLEASNLPLSNTEWGSGKIELSAISYRSRGCKDYVYSYSQQGEIKYKIVSKGIPKRRVTQEQMEKLLHEKDVSFVVEFTVITNTSRMLKEDGKIPFQRSATRTLGGIHKGNWYLDENCQWKIKGRNDTS